MHGNIVATRRLKCPLQVLKAGKLLRDVSSGTIVTVWANDPTAVIDVLHFCVEAGHRLLLKSDAGSHQIHVIKRTASA